MNTGVATRVLVALTLLVIVAGTINFMEFQDYRQYIHRFLSSRRAALAFADGLRQTSDDLTRMIRLYAVTGDPVYIEYFDEILAIRNGESPRPVKYFEIPYWDIVLDTGIRQVEYGDAVPVRELARDAGLFENELALFVAAEDASNELAVLEVEVMEVIAASIEAGGGNYVLEGDALAAAQRLHGLDYHAAKARVMEPLVELDTQINSALTAGHKEIVRRNNNYMANALGLVTLAALLILARMWQRRRQQARLDSMES
ncbi:MAG: hypothetical protein OXF44_08645 [Anaerolineaceae bacterium]|nr:hypothetical protein [Anaerolineaceae bacterium]